MFLHVFEYEVVSIADDKSMFEDLNNGAYVEVLWPIELWFVWCTIRLSHPCALKELSTNASRISHWWFMDGYHVVWQTVADNKFAPFIFWFGGVLKLYKHRSH